MVTEQITGQGTQQETVTENETIGPGGLAAEPGIAAEAKITDDDQQSVYLRDTISIFVQVFHFCVIIIVLKNICKPNGETNLILCKG